MGQLAILFSILFLVFNSFGTLENSPFQPHDDKRFHNIEKLYESPATDGDQFKRVVRAELNCGTSDCSVGTVDMGQDLPADAIISQAWFYVVTQFVDSGSGTVALHCEDANNIYSAADITGNSDGAIVAGAPDGTAGNMVASIAASCDITATIATAEQTAGHLVLYVEYVVAE